MPFEAELNALLHPPRLYSWTDLSNDPQTPPKRRGLYAWYFDPVPRGVPTQGCHRVEEGTLLYVGISPSRASSSGTLQSRIRSHYRGNASGSTLRKSLACLLEEGLRTSLRRVGISQRIRLPEEGEDRLKDWMAAHARVCWVEHPEPWSVEGAILTSLDLPLNLRGNETHPFYGDLKALRARCVEEARRLPVLRRS